MTWHLLLFLLIHGSTSTRNATDPPEITAVSAMCSSDGITASVDFDGPFNGKIYSLDYANVHDCLYYNALDMDTILFSIPAHRCGTRLSRTTRNVVDQMTNRVYVQMDRDFQSSHDKQFSFVCQLSEGRKFEEKGEPEIRRAPQKDIGYVTPPPLAPSVTPVKALSTDARQFGNWPIPGAKSYDSSMKPAPVFPRYPVGPPISPVYDANSYVKSAPQRAPPLPQYIPQSTPKPIIAQTQRDPVVPIRAPQLPHKPAIPTYQSAPPFPQLTDGYVRPPAPWLPQHSPPIIPSTVNKQQGIGMGLQPVKAEDDFTKVPAQTWNHLSTSGYVRAPEIVSQGPVIQRNEAISTLSPANRNSPIGQVSTPAKVFKEEGPRIGFTSDDNSIADHGVNILTEPLISQQQTRPTDVFLEIQRGDGPFSPPVSGAVKIGENISLVVRSTTKLTGENEFDMFVHSCFATDGPGSTRVQMMDERSCVLRPEFVGPMRRVKSNQQQFYFFRIAAFKFPGPDDVYFSCSIELTPNRTAPEICGGKTRWKREVDPKEQLRLFDIVKVELAEQWEQQKRLIEAASCVSPVVLTALSTSVVLLLLALLAVSYVAMKQHFRLN